MYVVVPCVTIECLMHDSSLVYRARPFLYSACLLYMCQLTQSVLPIITLCLQDLMSDQHLAAYLQVVEQNKAAATPYPGGHTYHHHGYASIHPGHTPQQAYYATRQYHHKNTY